jgi:MazG family protein
MSRGSCGEAFQRLVEVMAKLRGPDGCPWDQEQTHASLAPYLEEETKEILEAIERGDLASLRDELGDLLLQVVFHAEIAHGEDAFTITDVVEGLERKLVRRHPHVFGNLKVSGADEVHANWGRIKRMEALAAGDGRDLESLSSDDWQRYWEQAEQEQTS